MNEDATPMRVCETCVFWDERPHWPDSREGGELVGVCRRHAPRVVTIAPIEIDRLSDEPHTLHPSIDVLGVWALPAQTWASEWCGEWRGEWANSLGQKVRA